MHEFTIGRVYWKRLRKYLEECKFKGYIIEWFEGTGFTCRKFIIKGKDANEVCKAIYDMCR